MDECPSTSPYEYILYNLCIQSCLSGDFFDKKCIISNKNPELREEMINQIYNDIIGGVLDSIIFSTIFENKDFTVLEEDITYQMISSNNTQDLYNNVSSLNLGDCETKLKQHYNITENSSLLILKIDYIIPEFFIPVIEYKVFDPETKEPLNLDICQETPITLSYPVLKNISEEDIFKHNPNEKYYNDICFPYTTENKTDIILNDRKNEYNSNNLGLCENKCIFIGFNNMTKKSECNCEVKSNFNDFKTIIKNRDKILNNFIDFESVMNINIIRCFHNIFNIEGLKNNIGSYIILANFLISIINCSLFYIIEYKNTFKQINIIIKKKQQHNKTIKYKRGSIDYNSMNDNKESHYKKNININILSPPKKNNKINDFDKSSLNSNSSINKMANSLKIKTSSNNLTYKSDKINFSFVNKILDTDFNYGSKNLDNYTDNEINSLEFKEAINIDKRTYIQYYTSLLRAKHLIIFSFYTNNDYNPRIIKIILFLFSFVLLYTVNCLFFQDSTMHKIYEDYGKYNFIFQLPQILYSTIISFIITSIIKQLSLIEKKIIEIKNSKDININSVKLNKIIKSLKIKFMMFFILVFLFLIAFWYYLSCFGAIYRNTQIHLLKDTIISFILSLIYPLGINLLPGLFRIRALKLRNKRGKCLYFISKVIQLI